MIITFSILIVPCVHHQQYPKTITRSHICWCKNQILQKGVIYCCYLSNMECCVENVTRYVIAHSWNYKLVVKINNKLFQI